MEEEYQEHVRFMCEQHSIALKELKDKITEAFIDYENNFHIKDHLFGGSGEVYNLLNNNLRWKSRVGVIESMRKTIKEQIEDTLNSTIIDSRSK